MKRALSGLMFGCIFLLVPPESYLFCESSQSSAAELEQKTISAGRPRLFIDQQELQRLRKRITTTHQKKWKKLKAAVDSALTESPPDYLPPRVGGDSTRPGTLNDEMLWQRQYGYKLPGMALVALLDKDPKYFELVRRWALQPGKYPLWGAGIYENTGLAAKHQLFGISIAYDWLYDRWPDSDRQQLKQTLRERGRILYEAAEGINDRGWWKHAWRQNHAWNGYQALAVTAIALAGEEPDSGLWLEKALWGGHNIIQELPEEGAYEEGLPYWGYGMEALVRFLEAVRPYSEEDFYSYNYFGNTYLFRLHLAGPDVGQIANFGDGRTRDWHAMETTMYRLASQYRNPLTQWLAESMPERSDIDATCWGLLWFDASLKADLSTDTPRSHVFKETGFAGARTSWTSDAMTLHLRSGAADVSHSHLDVNNFLLNVAGEWLLRDYGYGKVGPGYFNKRTIYFSTGTWGHNCLVINGLHQLRDSDSIGRITDAVDTGGLVWWRSDASPCYLGTESEVRELVMVRPSVAGSESGFVVVRDRARTSDPSTFDFMLQPGGEVVVSGSQFRIQGKNTGLAGTVLAPTDVETTVEQGIGGNVNVDDPLSLRISSPDKSRETEFLVVLLPVKSGEDPPPIAMVEEVLQVGDTRLAFSRDGRSQPILKTSGK